MRKTRKICAKPNSTWKDFAWKFYHNLLDASEGWIFIIKLQSRAGFIMPPTQQMCHYWGHDRAIFSFLYPHATIVRDNQPIAPLLKTDDRAIFSFKYPNDIIVRDNQHFIYKWRIKATALWHLITSLVHEDLVDTNYVTTRFFCTSDVLKLPCHHLLHCHLHHLQAKFRFPSPSPLLLYKWRCYLCRPVKSRIRPTK